MENVHRICRWTDLSLNVQEWEFSVHYQCFMSRFGEKTGRRTHLQERKVMVDENSETSDRNDEELHSETVMVAVIGGPELHVDQVDCGIGTSDVDHLGKQQWTAHHLLRQGEMWDQYESWGLTGVLPSCLCYRGRWTRRADPGSAWWTLWQTGFGSFRRYL